MLTCPGSLRAGNWSTLFTVEFQVLAQCLASTETLRVLIWMNKQMNRLINELNNEDTRRYFQLRLSMTSLISILCKCILSWYQVLKTHLYTLTIRELLFLGFVCNHSQLRLLCNISIRIHFLFRCGMTGKS